jgi:membrane protease YdiL (CAAX protease family)
VWIRLREIRQFAPYLAVAAVPFVYYFSAGPLAVILVVAFALLAFSASDHGRKQLLTVTAIALALLPTALGLQLATPVLGAVGLAVAYVLARDHSIVRLPPPAAWIAAALAILGVVIFAWVWGALREQGSFGWRAETGLPSTGVPLVGAIIGISLINSVFEELMWRGWLADLVERTFSPKVVQIVFVSAAFGLSHFAGLPGGIVGIIATFFFGLAMAWVRSLSRGSLIACVVAHLAADAILVWRFYIA